MCLFSDTFCIYHNNLPQKGRSKLKLSRYVVPSLHKYVLEISWLNDWGFFVILKNIVEVERPILEQVFPILGRLFVDDYSLLLGKILFIMLIYVSLKTKEVISKVNITFSRLKKHFKVSFRENFVEY